MQQSHTRLQFINIQHTKKKKPQEAHTPCGREIGYAGLTLTTGENPDEQPPANNL